MIALFCCNLPDARTPPPSLGSTASIDQPPQRARAGLLEAGQFGQQPPPAGRDQAGLGDQGVVLQSADQPGGQLGERLGPAVVVLVQRARS